MAPSTLRGLPLLPLLPLLFLFLLQKRMSRMRVGSEQTMAAAEKLYQAGILSYPRTETDSFPADTDLTGLLQVMD